LLKLTPLPRLLRISEIRGRGYSCRSWCNPASNLPDGTCDNCYQCRKLGRTGMASVVYGKLSAQQCEAPIAVFAAKLLPTGNGRICPLGETVCELCKSINMPVRSNTDSLVVFTPLSTQGLSEMEICQNNFTDAFAQHNINCGS